MFFNRKKKELHYLDEFTDKEITDWINGKKNKVIDQIVDDYENYLANKTIKNRDNFLGFKDRDYKFFNMLSSDELLNELDNYISTAIKSPKYKEHIIAALENDIIRLNNSHK